MPATGIFGERSDMNVLKRRDFARWQASENLPDIALCNAVEEMERGLIDADLGAHLYKKRVARTGAGKADWCSTGGVL